MCRKSVNEGTLQAVGCRLQGARCLLQGFLRGRVTVSAFVGAMLLFAMANDNNERC